MRFEKVGKSSLLVGWLFNVPRDRCAQTVLRDRSAQTALKGQICSDSTKRTDLLRQY